MNLVEIIIVVVLVLAGIYIFLVSMMVKRHKDDAVIFYKLKKELDNSSEDCHRYEYSLYKFVAKFLMQKDAGVDPGRFLNIRYCNFIDIDKLNNAIRSYALLNSDNEIPLVMIDMSLYGNGKQGIIITTHGIYTRIPYQKYKNRSNATKFIWSDIDSIKLILKDKYAELVINNNIIGDTHLFKKGNTLKGKEGAILNELLQQLHQRIKQQSIEQGK